MRKRTLVFLIETTLPDEEFDTAIAPYTAATLETVAEGLKDGVIGRDVTETFTKTFDNGIVTRTSFIHGDCD